MLVSQVFDKSCHAPTGISLFVMINFCYLHLLLYYVNFLIWVQYQSLNTISASTSSASLIQAWVLAFVSPKEMVFDDVTKIYILFLVREQYEQNGINLPSF